MTLVLSWPEVIDRPVIGRVVTQRRPLLGRLEIDDRSVALSQELDHLDAQLEPTPRKNFLLVIPVGPR